MAELSNLIVIFAHTIRICITRTIDFHHAMKQIRPILLLMLTAILSLQAAHGQLTAAKCFADAPDDILPLLSRNTRLDMLDYYRAGADRRSSNVFEADCRILSIDSVGGSSSVTYLTGNGITGQIFVLNGDTPEPLIGIIETVETPLADSNMRMFDKTWQSVGNALAPSAGDMPLPAPKLADWLKRASDRSAVADRLPFVMAAYSYDPRGRELTVSHSMEGYFDKAEGADVLGKMRPQLTYVWDGKQFKQKKR